MERKKEHEWRGRGTSAIDHSPASTNGRTVKPAAANTRAALMAPLRNCPRRMWPKNVASARVAHGCTPSVTTAVKRRNVDGGGGVVAEVDVDILWVLCVVERGWLLLAVGFGWSSWSFSLSHFTSETGEIRTRHKKMSCFGPTDKV